MWFLWFIISYFICHTLFNFFLRSVNFYKFEEMKSEYSKSNVDPYTNRILTVIIFYIIFIILLFVLHFVNKGAMIVGNIVGFITGYLHYRTDLKTYQTQKKYNSIKLSLDQKDNSSSYVEKDYSQEDRMEAYSNVKENKINKVQGVFTYKTFDLPEDFFETEGYSGLYDLVVDLFKDIILEKQNNCESIDYHGLLDLIKEALHRINNLPEEEVKKIVYRFSRYYKEDFETEVSFLMNIEDFEEVFWILERIFENYISDNKFDALPDSLHKRAILIQNDAKIGDEKSLLLHSKNIGWGFEFKQDLIKYVKILSGLAYKGNIEARYLLGNLYNLSWSEFASKAACYSFSLGVNLKDKRSLLKMNNIKFLNFTQLDFNNYNFYTPTHDVFALLNLFKEQEVLKKMDVSSHLNDLTRIGKANFSNKAEGFLEINTIPFAIKPSKKINCVTLDINEYIKHLRYKGFNPELIKNNGFGYSNVDPIGYKHIKGINILDDYFNFIIPNVQGKWEPLEYYRIGSHENNVDQYFVSYKNPKNDVLVFVLYFWMYDNSETAFPFFENIYRLPKGFIPNNETTVNEYLFLEKTVLNVNENLFGNEFYYSLLIGETKCIKNI